MSLSFFLWHLPSLHLSLYSSLSLCFSLVPLHRRHARHFSVLSLMTTMTMKVPGHNRPTHRPTHRCGGLGGLNSSTYSSLLWACRTCGQQVGWAAGTNRRVVYKRQTTFIAL